MNRKQLGELEEIVLLTVAILFDEAHSIAIRDDLDKRLGRALSLGALHTTLVRLEEKSFVASHWGDPTPHRGGKRKRFYRVTKSGQEALQELKMTREALWQAIPGEAFRWADLGTTS